MILACVCKGYNGATTGAVYQDGLYGEGKRYHTPMAKENTFRCSVCLTEKNGPSKKMSKKEEAAEAAKAKEEQGAGKGKKK